LPTLDEFNALLKEQEHTLTEKKIQTQLAHLHNEVREARQADPTIPDDPVDRLAEELSGEESTGPWNFEIHTLHNPMEQAQHQPYWVWWHGADHKRHTLSKVRIEELNTYLWLRGIPEYQHFKLEIEAGAPLDIIRNTLLRDDWFTWPAQGSDIIVPI